MKRKLLFAALLLLAALVIVGAASALTDPIVCSMEVSPSSLSEPGEVTVTITVSNSGDTDMQEPLTLYNPTSEVVSDFGDNGSVTLKAGEVKTWTGPWEVNQHTLDNGQIVFFVKYALFDENGEREVKSQPIRGKLEVSEAKSGIEVKRTISPGTAREGQTVTVRYDIVNTGTVSLKNITIQENKDVNEKKLTVTDELKAGATAQVKFPVTMGTKDITSNAVITYTAGSSDTELTEKVDDQVIHYGEPAMTAKLTSSAKGVAVNGTITLTLELKNSGTVDYSNLRVTDPTLGDVFTNQELAAGGTLTLEKEITLTETTDYQFTIVAIDNTGTEVSLSTDPLTLTAIDESKVLHLNLIASADRTEVYTQPGIVRFTLTVENDSDVDAAEVTIYQANTEIYTFTSIPAGETRKLTRDAALSMAGKYQFTAVTQDALDNTNTFESNEIQIAFSVPTPAPATPTPPAEPTPEPTYAVVTYVPISNPSVGSTAKLIRAFFYPLMIVSGILLIGVAVLLILATRKRYLEKKAYDAALDHLDRVKRRDYVAPGEEEAAPPAEPAAPADEAAAPEAESAVFEGDTTEEPLHEEELPHMKYVRNAYQRSGSAQNADEGHGFTAKTYATDEAYRKPAEPAQPAEAEAPEYDAQSYAEEQEAYREADDYGDDTMGYEEEPFSEPQEDADNLTGYRDRGDRPAYEPADDDAAYDAEPDGYEASDGDEWADNETPQTDEPHPSTRRRRRRADDQPTKQ